MEAKQFEDLCISKTKSKYDDCSCCLITADRCEMIVLFSRNGGGDEMGATICVCKNCWTQVKNQIENLLDIAVSSEGKL